MKLTRRILLVEDSPADTELIRLSFLKMAPPAFELVAFASGEEFLSYVESHPEPEAAFILLDLNMPRMSGFDVLEKMQSQGKVRDIPIVVFSSSMQHGDMSRCYELGANAFITKPFDVAEFDSTIQAISRFWGNQRSPASTPEPVLD
jgi:CheY-like chemotaxis protein